MQASPCLLCFEVFHYGEGLPLKASFSLYLAWLKEGLRNLRRGCVDLERVCMTWGELYDSRATFCGHLLFSPYELLWECIALENYLLQVKKWCQLIVFASRAGLQDCWKVAAKWRISRYAKAGLCAQGGWAEGSWPARGADTQPVGPGLQRQTVHLESGA